MQYFSYQITIFAKLPPPSKCRLVRPAPPAPSSLRLCQLAFLLLSHSVVTTMSWTVLGWRIYIIMWCNALKRRCPYW